MIKKICATVVAAVLLTACSKDDNFYSAHETDYTHAMATLPALNGCRAYSVKAGNNSITVVRCPNSTTTVTYPVGKATASVTTVDNTALAAPAESTIDYTAQLRADALAKLSPQEKDALGIR